MMLNIFSCVYFYLYILFNKTFLLIFAHFLFGIFHFLKNYFIVVQLQLSVFTPCYSPPPQPNPPPSLASTPLLDFVHVSFIVVPENPYPPLSPPNSPLVTVRLFLISMSLVIFCLLFFLLSIRFLLKVRSYGNFLILSFESSCCILDTSPVSDA